MLTPEAPTLAIELDKLRTPTSETEYILSLAKKLPPTAEARLLALATTGEAWTFGNLKHILVTTPQAYEQLTQAFAAAGFRIDAVQGGMKPLDFSGQVNTRAVAQFLAGTYDYGLLRQYGWRSARTKLQGRLQGTHFADDIRIYKAYDWPLLTSSPAVHEVILRLCGVDPDTNWYTLSTQIGSGTLAQIEKFLRNFTDLDADAFGKLSDQGAFRGPMAEAITKIGEFCHPAPLVTANPSVVHSLEVIAGWVDDPLYLMKLTEVLSLAEDLTAVEAWTKGLQDLPQAELLRITTQFAQDERLPLSVRKVFAGVFNNLNAGNN